MQIKELLKENETVVVKGRVYKNESLKECGDLIVTDRRILTQFGEAISISKISEVVQISTCCTSPYNNYVIYVLLDGDNREDLYFATNADWRAWKDTVFEALSKYTT